MKKILYISDYTFDVYNSVNDILYNIVTMPEMEKFENIIAKVDGRGRYPLNITYLKNVKTFTAPEQNLHYVLRDKKFAVSERVQCLYRRLLFSIAERRNKVKEFNKEDNIKYIDNVIKRVRPDLVVFYIFTPNTDYVNVCKKRKIPYISILYDTYIERPQVKKDVGIKNEKYVIDNSKGHFIPSFFYDGYLKYYNNNKHVIKFDLPLLIDKYSVQKAYENVDAQYNFAYFGQIQTFRNGDRIKEIFRELGLKLDIFSSFDYESDDVYITHSALTQKDLYNVVACSKFLVALDNSVPYSNYLPSKAYLYSSFTKPVIAFGDNEDSALKRYFKNYPLFYYQNINQPLDGLMEFINSVKTDKFDEDLYNNYLQYLPENALKPLLEIIDNIMSSKN